jgi:hypothetical protein
MGIKKIQKEMIVMSTVNATTHFTQAQVQEMNELVAINEEMKKLEAKKKTLSDNVKKYMVAAKIDKVSVNGNVLGLTESVRRTVTKATKDEFIANLVGMGKKHLVNYSIEPDLDSIFAEVDAGTLGQDFVDAYVKVTPVVTLRCN